MERTAPLDQPTYTTMTSNNRNIFRFFDLPRELRDNIYERLPTRHARVKGGRCGLTYVRDLRFPFFPVLDLLLVSSQFEQEYEEAIARDSRSKELVVEMDLRKVTTVWGATRNSLLDRLYAIENIEVRQNRRILDVRWEKSQSGANEDMYRLLPLMPNLKHFTSAIGFKADVFESLVLHGLTKASYEADTIANWLLDGVEGRYGGSMEHKGREENFLGRVSLALHLSLRGWNEELRVSSLRVAAYLLLIGDLLAGPQTQRLEC